MLSFRAPTFFRILLLLLAFTTSVSAFLGSAAGVRQQRPNHHIAFSTKVDTMAEVKAGDKIGSIVMMEGLGNFEKQEVNIAELIAGKKVILFGVPGAFTPGCSKSHLPSFIDAQDELKKKGVDLTICVATNDLFVLEAWGRTSGGSAAGIRFLSDHQAELSRSLGLVMESPMMPRTKRFSLIVDDGVVSHYFSSSEEASNTWAPTVLAKL